MLALYSVLREVPGIVSGVAHPLGADWLLENQDVSMYIKGQGSSHAHFTPRAASDWLERSHSKTTSLPKAQAGQDRVRGMDGNELAGERLRSYF